LLKDFNLIVSTSRGNERNTCSEMWYLLGEVGDRGSTVEPTPAIGWLSQRLSSSRSKPFMIYEPYSRRDHGSSSTP